MMLVKNNTIDNKNENSNIKFNFKITNDEIDVKVVFLQKDKKISSMRMFKMKKKKCKKKRFFFKNVKQIQKIKIKLCFKCRKKNIMKGNNIGLLLKIRILLKLP